MRSLHPAWSPALAAAVILTGGLTLLRLLALFNTPLELYPDEAQYWLWSRELAWGYYSKPPMVAWLIAASTAVGGDAEPWVRLGAALAHGLTPLALYAAGARLYSAWTGFWAAALYCLMPGVQLSAVVMTTDSAMLLFLSFAVWAYAAFVRSDSERIRAAAAAALGAALGLAVLSKYASVYFIIGLALHALVDPSARRRWTGAGVGLAAATSAVVIAPNLLWNAAHGFATVSHTAANANWRTGALFSPAEALSFLGSQFGVFGLLPLLALAIGAAVCLRRPGRMAREDLALLCLALPPLLIVTVQAFISRANANWAVAAYAPASVLVAAWLVRHRARWTLSGVVLSQGAVAALLLLVSVSTPVTTALGLDNAVKRARGWEALTRAVTARAEGADLTAVSVDDRFLFNALAYYGRDFWSRPDAPPLRAWVRRAQPQNQAESEAPLTPEQSARVLHLSLEPDFVAEASRDFRSWRSLGVLSVRLDRERTRDVQVFLASGYRRAPRDPVTGIPTAP
jgi:4-amino-4-deoxy-L-arabinose transferase-like glycosyltransferase